MKKILIIDDNEAFAKILKDALPKEQFIVISATNGKEGLKQMNAESLDLIILDLLMPQMGGVEFLNALKTTGGNKIPILISSQVSKMEDISNAIVAGMDVGVKGYIIKASENLDKIVQEIEEALEKNSKK
jgi:CheY-like chemotaxis protein